MHIAYWLLIVITFGVHDELGGTQPAHYATEQQCKAEGAIFIAPYVGKGPSRMMEFRCMPVYPPR